MSGSQLTGTGVSPGIGVGPLARLGKPVKSPPPDVEVKGEKGSDHERAKRAFDEVAADLTARAERADGEAAPVLEAQAMMAQDPTLHDLVSGRIDDGKTAAYAVDEAINGFKSQLEALGGYMAERAADLDDLRSRIVSRLLHLPMPGVPDRDDPFVLVAEDLAPADTVDLDPAVVMALVTEKGGPTSHTAIIAKSMGIPAIVGCAGILDIAEETKLVVDGSTGVTIVDATDAEVAEARERKERRAAALAQSSGPGRTKDGHGVKLLLNLGEGDDAAAGEIDSEGVGLLRTEFLFLDRDSEPTHDEQVEAYRRTLQAFGGRRVVVRTLDIGADKPSPFVPTGPGDNPALGLRGWRLTDLEPGIVERQLDALAEAAKDTEADLWVMAPMIATVEEAEAVVEAGRSRGLETMGVMVEVPAAAIQAERFVEVVDFLSIGTNDLSQYTLAADRLVSELGKLLDPWQPAVLDLIAMAAAAGKDADTPVGVCGEAASDPLLARVLVGLGCTSLSMAPTSVPEVRASLAGVTYDECVELAGLARDARTAEAARLAVADVHHDDSAS